MSVQAAEDPTHFGAGLFPILTAGMQMLRQSELGPDIAIVAASQKVFEVPAAAFFSRAGGEIFRFNPQAQLISDEQLRMAADVQDPSIDAVKRVSLIPVRLGEAVIGSLGIVGRILSPAAC